MAIGLSLTPRSYNVDPTGRDYVLDPDPLLNIAEKSFAAQRENLRTMAGVMQQGVALGEMIGARQQLGRVKAALSELDVNDPLFAQKYSAVVADNPLAFTNERVAPVTKAAVTPVLASAAQAMENRAALQRAQVMAGYQRQAAVQRADLQRDYYDYQIQNPRPTAPKPPSFGEQLMRGTLDAPAAPVRPPAPASPVGATSSSRYRVNGVPDPGDLPVAREWDAPVGTGPELTDPYYPPPPGPAFEPDDEVTGEQGDSSGMAFSNGVFQSPSGVWDVSTVTADGVTASPRVVAMRPDAEPGKRVVPKKFNPDTTVAEYQQEDIPTAILNQRDALFDALIDTDPGIAALNQNAALLSETYKAAKDSLASLPEDKKGAAAEALVPQAAAAAIATSAATAAKAQAKVQMLAGEYPEAAAIFEARRKEQEAATIQPQGTGEYGYEDLLLGGTPAQPASSIAPPPSAQEIVAQRTAAEDGTNRRWDAEKKFVAAEADRIDSALEFPRGTLLRAVEKNDSRELNAILTEMARRGIKSPLFVEGARRPSLGLSGVTSAAGPMEFASSPLVKQSYRNVLRAVAKETPGATGGGSGFKWTRK